MGILDWLFEREKNWVVLHRSKAAYFFLGSNGAMLTHELSLAKRFTKGEARRVAKDLGWMSYTYIEDEYDGRV